jgi:hypothetical protein
VFQQFMRRLDDLELRCRNKVNINLSFFSLDLASPADETNPDVTPLPRSSPGTF